MAKEDLVEFEGVVTAVPSHGNFKVTLDNGHSINAKLSGKMRKFYIKVVQGDKVTVGISPYDKTHGLIQFRHKVKNNNPNPNPNWKKR